jgi:hypothetical protein
VSTAFHWRPTTSTAVARGAKRRAAENRCYAPSFERLMKAPPHCGDQPTRRRYPVSCEMHVRAILFERLPRTVLDSRLRCAVEWHHSARRTPHAPMLRLLEPRGWRRRHGAKRRCGSCLLAGVHAFSSVEGDAASFLSRVGSRLIAICIPS